MQRSDRSGLTPQEIDDRLAIRELVDAYAHCADRQDVEGQIFLFTADAEFLVYMDSRNAVPTQEIRGRDMLRPVFENLSSYEATTHFNGQSTVEWAPDSVTGVSYCLAHHVKSQPDDSINSLSGSFREDGWTLVLPATKLDGRLDRQPPTGRSLTRLDWAEPWRLGTEHDRPLAII
jgi:SnoaL-like domain